MGQAAPPTNDLPPSLFDLSPPADTDPPPTVPPFNLLNDFPESSTPVPDEKFDKRDVLRNVSDTGMKIDDNGEDNNSE